MAMKRITAERKTPARKPAVRRGKKTVTHDQIAEHAYFLSLRGRADPLANWLEAERELADA